MAEQIRKTPASKIAESESSEALPHASHKSGDELKAEMDDLLDEIDSLLEENEMVAETYIQAGGE